MTPTSSDLDISVVVPTYNRGPQLRTMLDGILDQETDGVRYEVVVVDNNSTDGTRAVVEETIRRAASVPMRYVFEPRQGVSYARNTGAQHASAPIVAFLDDDGVPVRTWVKEMKQAFDAHPDADCIGGRVRASWSTPAPAWMTPAHWGPIALQDRPHAAWIDRSSASACLISANIGCRRSVFTDVGWFSADYPRNQDREWELRLWHAGKRGLYLPAMDVVVDVPAHRLEKRYHRRWQRTTGGYHARMRFRDTVDANGRLIPESPTARRFLGVPLFMYRDLLRQVGGWFAALFQGDRNKRFYHETRLWYYLGFFTTRFRTDVMPRLTPRLRQAPQVNA
jgi:glucosyl-dolichyl phosphate glucuronosyltransferase